MKTTNIFKKIFFATTLLGAVILVPACDKDDDDDNTATTYTLSGDASGSQQNPPVTTGGSATLTGTYNSGTNRLDYTINWTGLSGIVTVAHIHGPALVSENAGPIVDLNLTVNGISGTASGSATLADSTEAYLLSGKLYYNIHTALNVDGEVRGQIATTANE